MHTTIAAFLLNRRNINDYLARRPCITLKYLYVGWRTCLVRARPVISHAHNDYSLPAKQEQSTTWRTSIRKPLNFHQFYYKDVEKKNSLYVQEFHRTCLGSSDQTEMASSTIVRGGSDRCASLPPLAHKTPFWQSVSLRKGRIFHRKNSIYYSIEDRCQLGITF